MRCCFFKLKVLWTYFFWLHCISHLCFFSTLIGLREFDNWPSYYCCCPKSFNNLIVKISLQILLIHFVHYLYFLSDWIFTCILIYLILFIALILRRIHFRLILILDIKTFSILFLFFFEILLNLLHSFKSFFLILFHFVNNVVILSISFKISFHDSSKFLSILNFNILHIFSKS